MNAVKLIPNYTYDDYSQWEGRWEIIDGIPFAMSPSPSLRHQWITANIIGELRNDLKKAKCKKCRVFDLIDLKIENNTVVQPDCSIVCGTLTGNFLDIPPSLAVEVLSPATVLKDLHTKFSIYEKFGIRYYLIVDPEKEEVEIYHLIESKYTLQHFSPEESFFFRLNEDCTIEVSVKNFWE